MATVVWWHGPHAACHTHAPHNLFHWFYDCRLNNDF
jgi:hypothetical protein